jgi:hypothetical protein
MSTRRASNPGRAPRYRGITCRLTIVVAATIAMVAALDAPAHAGVYTVTGCRTGWVPDVRNTGGNVVPSAFDQCDQATSRSLHASLPGSTNSPEGLRANAGDYSGWRFDAPPDTAIVGLSLTWNGRGDYAGSSWSPATVEVATSSNAQVVGRIDPFQTADHFELQDASWVRAYVLCRGQTGSTCRTTFFDVNGAPDVVRLAMQHTSVSLLDRAAPEVADGAGAAVADGVWAGPQPLVFSASDKGGGLFQVAVEVDGRVIATFPRSVGRPLRR